MTNKSYLDVYRDIIPDYKMFCESINLPAPTHIRINTLKADPVRVKRGMEKRGIKLKSAGDKEGLFFEICDSISSGNLPEYFMGHIHPQALTSCIAASALSPQKDRLVLDMCASPGGKTSHLSDIISNTGLVVANEIYPGRRIPLAHTLFRLGVMNSVQTGYQAQEFPLRERFDYILADVPCSGEGRLRIDKKQDRFRNIRSRASNKLLELQKKIIIRGFDLLKDEGVMLYATCTYNPEENESVVQHLLDNREAEILPLKCDFPFERGLNQWRKWNYDRKMERAARFYPHRVNSVGFFMARIGKRKR